MRAPMAALVLVVVGCAPPIEEGRFACATDVECPDTWVCRDDGRCWRTPGEVDAGEVDVGELDAGDADAGPEDAGADAGPPDAGPDAGVDACVPRPVNVDLLVMVDQSGSMEASQDLIADAFPALLRAIATGDFDGDSIRDVPRVDSLHVGVITSDLGANGNTISTCDNSEDAILVDRRLAGQEPPCEGTYGPVLQYEAGDAVSSLNAPFACLSAVGATGCGFEQQLEATVKALTPADSALLFFDGTEGHGDGANAGFLRADSVVVVVLLTDEEDCSTHDRALFDPSPGGTYAGTDLNRRCYDHDDVLLPISRFVGGLAALREDPADLVVVPIVGFPPALVGEDAETILAHPDMTYSFEAQPTRPDPACESTDGMRSAAPGRRYVQLADGLVEEGAQVVLRSICEPDFSGAIDGLLQALEPRLNARACE